MGEEVCLLPPHGPRVLAVVSERVSFSEDTAKGQLRCEMLQGWEWIPCVGNYTASSRKTFLSSEASRLIIAEAKKIEFRRI